MVSPFYELGIIASLRSIEIYFQELCQRPVFLDNNKKASKD